VTLDISDYLGKVERQEEAPPDWNLPIDHWSPSSFAMLQRCPRQWQERYIHGRKERPAESIVVGSAVHVAVEMNFKQKIESHADVPTADLLDYYESAWPVVISQQQENAGDDVLWDTDANEAGKRGRLMLAAYQNIVAPRIQPLAVETFVTVDVGLPIPIEGRFDVERDASVIDLKSGKRAQRKPKEAWRIQGVVYGEARNKAVEFHSISASQSSSKVTVVTPLESELLLIQPSWAERQSRLRILRALSDEACFYMERYGPDEPWPPKGVYHDWACDYCGYRSDCPAWRAT